MPVEPELVDDRMKASKARIRRVLEEELAQVRSPEEAEAILDHLEELAAGETEAGAAERVEQVAMPAATAVEGSARAPSAAQPKQEVATVLATTAAEAVADTKEAPAVVAAAIDTLGPGAVAASAAERSEVQRGREWLKEAVLRRMGPLQAADARIYLVLNGLPHPRWADRLGNAVTFITTGGWVWMLGVLVAKRLGVPRGRETLHVMLPCVAGATWIVENPVKAYFRRRRPFIDIVRALVVGKKPGSWSFPSGHTASSFASAWMLATVWKKQSPLFFLLASSVGFSRVYVGAHYPGDVAAGAAAGVVFTELLRRLSRYALD